MAPSRPPRLLLAAALCCGTALLLAGRPAAALDASSVLAQLRHHRIVTSTVPANGDQNPYAIVVAPASAGKIRKDDVLISNFNDDKNLQGLGTTIVSWRPSAGTLSTFAALPRQMPAGGPSCPGGIGLTTAMAVLSTGYVLVGSLPSADGTTGTKGPGCILVLDPDGRPVDSITGPDIDGPWGNMAVREHGSGATVFVSNTGFGVGAATDAPPVVNKATILRLRLSWNGAGAPRVTGRAVIAAGLGEQADKGVFIIGPTGLALDPDGTLYASDAIANRIIAIPDALARTGPDANPREITRGGLLNRPLALVRAPNGHLIATNALNGQAVEIDPRTGRQIGAQWFDTDKAQSPPGSGDLFGIAATPDGKGYYYVEDDVNTLNLAE